MRYKVREDKGGGERSLHYSVYMVDFGESTFWHVIQKISKRARIVQSIRTMKVYGVDTDRHLST